MERRHLVDHKDQKFSVRRQGFGYLFPITDWFSRYVVEWNVSPLLETEFCLEPLEKAFFYTRPEIFNADQGVQFTSLKFTERLGGMKA